MSNQPPADASAPLASVIVVTYNSEATVGETLSSLAQQTYPTDRYELIVVDGGSSDETKPIVDEYDATFHVVEDGTIGACRNHGIDVATGEYIAFTDSDCAVPATWLEAHVDRIESRDDDSIVGVGGPNRPFPDDPWFSKLVGSLQGTIFGSGGSPQSYTIDEVRLVRSVAACNVMYDATIFESYRYDDAINVGEDAELHFRLSEAGYRFVFDPAITVSHHLSANFGAYNKKSRSYGYAMARIQRRNRKVIRWYSALPSLALGTGVLATLADIASPPPQYVPLLLLPFLLVCGYSTALVYHDRRSLVALLVPLMLAAQYTYYGIGFLEGMIASDPVPQELP